MKNKTKKRFKYFLDHPQIKRAKSPGNNSGWVGGVEGTGSQKKEVKDFGKRMGFTKTKSIPAPKPKEKKGATLEKAQKLNQRP